jgi:hypothetical protein
LDFLAPAAAGETVDVAPGIVGPVVCGGAVGPGAGVSGAGGVATGVGVAGGIVGVGVSGFINAFLLSGLAYTDLTTSQLLLQAFISPSQKVSYFFCANTYSQTNLHVLPDLDELIHAEQRAGQL